MLLLVLGTAPGVVAAETRSGGTVVVGADETVDGLEAFGGTIIVRGTVDGNLQAFGGDVRIEGEVTGDVEAFAGNVWIGGTVGGDVEASGGNVNVAPDAEIGGSLSAAAGNLLVAGSVGGNAELAAGTITLAETATIDGDVEYAVDEEDDFQNRGATVAGSITRVEDLGAGPWEDPVVPNWVFGVYGFLANLLLGAILLVLFPRTSDEVALSVAEEPVRTGLIGLAALIVIPVLLVVLVITIIGIPIALIGALLFALLLWVGLVYGRFAIGMILVALADVDSRFAGLLVGLIVLGVVSLIPWVGGLVDFLVLLLGLGALASVVYAGYRDRREAPE